MFAVIMSTIFIGIGLSEVYRLLQNTEMMGVPNPVSGAPIFLGDVIITKEQIWVFGGAILSALLGLAIFSYAKLGRGCAPWPPMFAAPFCAVIRPTG